VYLTQNAFHAGPVTASQTTLVIVDPLVSMAIGLALFGDRIHTAGIRGPLEVAALVGLFVGASVLSTAPLIAHMKSPESESESESDVVAPPLVLNAANGRDGHRRRRREPGAVSSRL
jgi:hypothetical protein